MVGVSRRTSIVWSAIRLLPQGWAVNFPPDVAAVNDVVYFTDEIAGKLMDAGRDSTATLLGELRGRLARHEIAPGRWLREQDLADEFGVSRAQVGEALTALTVLGLAERVPNRGILARRLDLSAILKVLQLRAVEEGLCARLAAENGPPARWQPLLDLFGAP